MSDQMLVKASSKVLRAIGELLRDAVEQTTIADTSALSRDDWTLIEEIATGFENR